MDNTPKIERRGRPQIYKTAEERRIGQLEGQARFRAKRRGGAPPNPNGRPPKYATEEERKEAQKILGKISHKKWRDNNAEHIRQRRRELYAERKQRQIESERAAQAAEAEIQA